MERHKTVLEFIQRRFPQQFDCNWTTGNCYYFAQILLARFKWLKLYYAPISGHFVAGCSDRFYDWNGEWKPEGNDMPIAFEVLKKDQLWYERLIRDCVN